MNLYKLSRELLSLVFGMHSSSCRHIMSWWKSINHTLWALEYLHSSFFMCLDLNASDITQTGVRLKAYCMEVKCEAHVKKCISCCVCLMPEVALNVFVCHTVCVCSSALVTKLNIMQWNFVNFSFVSSFFFTFHCPELWEIVAQRLLTIFFFYMEGQVEFDRFSLAISISCYKLYIQNFFFKIIFLWCSVIQLC